MSEVPEHVGTTGGNVSDVELTERQLFQLATGESVTVEVPNAGGPGALTLTVTPPTPFDDLT